VRRDRTIVALTTIPVNRGCWRQPGRYAGPRCRRLVRQPPDHLVAPAEKLFVCSKGHYWRVAADQEDVHAVADAIAPEATLDDLVEELGQGVREVLGDEG
jgi:hypothetical protein